jgi:hypothetical protein
MDNDNGLIESSDPDAASHPGNTNAVLLGMALSHCVLRAD